MSLTSCVDVTLMAARLPRSLLWSFLMLAVMVASSTFAASYSFAVISLVFSIRESRLVSASICAWTSLIELAWATTGVTINDATLNAKNNEGK